MVLANHGSLQLPAQPPAARPQAKGRRGRRHEGPPAGSDAAPLNRKNLHCVVDDLLARGGQRIAVEDGGRLVDYRTLDRLANGLAGRLTAAGIGPGQVVGLPMRASAEYVVALLATVKAGGIFMPLDPAYPEARLRRILALARPRLLLAAEGGLPAAETMAGLAPSALPVLGVDLQAAGETPARPPVTVGDDDTGYLIHTSGSTGEPKLIAGRNKGISHFVHWEMRELGIGDEVRASFFAPPTFDVSLREIFVPLLAGGRLVIPTPELRADADRLVTWLRQSGITLMHCVPSLFRLLTRALGEQRADGQPGLPALSIAALAGEPLYGADVAAWRQAAGAGTTLINLYGPSETTLAKAFHRVDGESYAPGAIVPIGQPIANTALLLLRDGRLCDIGEIGEIHIRTPFASNGYFGDEERTRQAFVVNPLTDDPADRIYRTGDLGRYRADRSVEFVGRSDRQVKVNGVRIELPEIEGAIRACPAVTEAAAQVFRMADGGLRLVGYFSGALDPAGLRAHLATLLPEAMIPSHLQRLEAFPRNLNGKIDRKALPRPESLMEQQRDDAPAGATETALAGMWAESLELSRVGATSPWLQIGGNSLRAIGLIGRINRRFGANLTIRDFFEQGTVRALARLIDERRGSAAAPLPRAAEAPDYPLTDAQRRLWILSRLADSQTLYNNPEWLELEGPLDAMALERAFQTLVDRHESLRTVFIQRDGEPRQRILPPWTIGLPVEVMTPGSDPSADFAALAALPFDLAAGPLLRARLLEETPTRHHLLVSMHHIVCDGWSMSILVRELAAAYNAALAGGGLDLPQPAYRPRDFAAWACRPEAETAMAPHRAHWQSLLADADDRAMLPADPACRDVEPWRAGRLAVELPAATVERLRSVLAERQATSFMGVAAALSVLLFRYGGSGTVVLGTPVSGRGRPELAEVVGFFVNTLPLALRVAPEDSFATLLERVRRAVGELNEHQDYPFDRLIADRAGAGQRDLARNPLFEIMLAMEPPPTDPGFRQLRMIEREAPETAARYDLALRLADDGQRLRLIVEYRMSLFAAPAMERLGRHLANLLAGLSAAPEAALGAVAMLDAAETAELAAFAEGPHRPLPETTIPALFAERAAAWPTAPALLFAGAEGAVAGMDYRTLDRRANALAHRLAARVPAGGVTAVLLERGPAWAVALLAAMKAGTVYLPLDPRHPPARLAELLADAGAQALIATPELAALTGTALTGAAQADATLACLDPAGTEEAPAPPERPRQPDDAAYLIYTSGSTGKPKGVLVQHRAFLNMILDQIDTLGVGPADRILQFVSPAFDVSLFEAFLALLSGAALGLADRTEAATPQGYAAWLGRFGVSIGITTPGFLRSLAGMPLPTLRLLITGGEPPHPDEVRRRLDGGIRYVNAYGPTEAAVNAAIHAFEAGIPPTAPLPLGRPTANTALQVVAPDLTPLPLGVPGELAIAGAGVALGYRDRPAQTARAFASLPDGRRLYRSGDRACRRADGSLVFLGRIDHQVKIAGHRVELGEVEAALRRLPGVADARVLPRPVGDELELAAYWLGTEEAAPGLRDALASVLPDHEVPRFFVRLDALPLNANGKLDQARLPDPRAAAPAAWDPPHNSMEVALVALWREILGTQAVGRNGDFFDLGGRSLAANRLALRASRVLSMPVGLADIYGAPTPALLAARLRRNGAAAAPTPCLPEERDAPLSPMQRRLWVIDGLGDSGAVYHISGLTRLQGRLDAKALDAALVDLVTRHAVLRSRIVTVAGEPRQIADTPPASLLEQVDARGWSAARLALAVEERLARRFRLDAESPLRATLFAMGEDDWRLLLVLHHIAADGWSMPILDRELAAAYNARRAGHEPAWDALPAQYRDLAVWQADRLAAGDLAQAADYWRQRLAGPLPVLDLPTDRPRPPVRGFRGETREHRLPPACLAAVAGLARNLGATPFAVLLAGVQTLLHRLSGQDDIILGTPFAGRERPESEGLIGFFVNTLPLRAALPAGQSFAERVRLNAAMLAEAAAHQAYPFDRLVADLDLPRDTARSPVFDVMISLAEEDGPPAALDGLAATPLPVSRRGSRCDLSFMFALGAEGASLGLEYDSDLFDVRRIDDLALRLARLLESAAAAPETTLARLDWLHPGERDWLLHDLNRTDAALPQRTVLQLFEEQAATHPLQPALIADDEEWTYDRLNRAANRLAHGLKARLPDGPKAPPVAILAERGPAMIAALLAVLKCGAAYLPVEPETPAARLALLVADSGARLLLHDPAVALPAGLDVEVMPLAAPPAGPEDNLPAGPALTDPIYVIYTSGSTGRPKGVVVEHRSVLRLVAANPYFVPAPGDRILQLSNYAFDGSVFDIFAALCHGLPLCLPDREAVQDPARLAAFIRRHGVTVSFITTALFNRLVEDAPDALAAFRRLYFGGQEASLAHLRQAKARMHPDALVHVYGPTEVTTFATWHPVSQADLGEAALRLPIGRPIANTRAYVLDQSMQPVPPGVAGELYLGGEGVARGYLGRPELTAERFLASPFHEGDRLYRSGDLCRLRADGAIEFLGRIDGQVKLRGYRVELGEIEHRLLGHPSVASAHVMPRANGAGNLELVAYFTVAEGPVPELASLRAHLERWLPGYMIPAHMVALPELPLNSNGKVDRAALPPPEAAGLPAAGQRVPPANAAEQALWDAWRAVLGHERFGVRDNYFALGGDSIQAIQIAVKLREAGYALKVTDLLRRPTIEALAGCLQPLAPAPQAAVAPPREPATGEAPLTPIQTWFMAQDFASPRHFNQSVLLRLPAGTDADALNRALAALLDRHDALRLAFGGTGQAAWQRALPPGPATLLDVPELPAADPAAAMAAHIEALQRSFLPDQGGLLRAALYRLPDGDRLFLTIHHWAIDGVSWRILLADLAAALAMDGGTIALPRSSAFLDWARHLAAEGPGRFAGQAGYWRSQAAATVAVLPRRGNGPGRPAPLAERLTCEFRLSPADSEAVLGLCHSAYRTSGDELLLGALVRSVCRLTGRRSCRIAMESHGREPLFEDLDISRTVGWFTAIYPLVFNLPDDDLSRQIREVKEALRTVPDRGIGYGVLRYLAQDPVLAAGPAAEIGFNYLGRLDGDLPYPLAEESTGAELAPDTRLPHGLDITAEMQGGQLRIRLVGDAKRHPEDFFRSLAVDFQQSLDEVIAHCRSPQAGALSPSDVDFEGLDVAGLDAFLDGLEG